MQFRAEDLTLNVRAYALGWVYKLALYTVHTCTHVRSRARGPDPSRLGRVYKSALYSTHTLTHSACVRSRAEDLTLNVRSYALGWVYKSALYIVQTRTHVRSRARGPDPSSPRLHPRSGIQVSFVYCTHTHVQSRAEDLTLHVCTYALGQVYKSTLYTVHTYTYTYTLHVCDLEQRT